MMQQDIRKRIPAGPRYTRVEMEILANGADSLAGIYRMGKQPIEMAECEEVARMAREAAAKLP